MNAHPLDKSRRIIERLIIEGALVLETPTHLGNGDTDGIVDMPLLLDEATKAALLPGTSLAGALRNYLREHRNGFGASRPRTDKVVEGLFGAEKGNDKGSQSALLIDDALAEKPRIELRDGVRIDPATRTAKIDFRDGRPRGFKYDYQLLEAGTTFNLRMELLLTENDDQVSLKKGLATVLQGLQQGEIAIGLRKRRGFGRCKVNEWRVTCYDLTTSAGLLAWVAQDHPAWVTSSDCNPGADIAQLLGVTIDKNEDQRNICHLHAQFALDSSLLIRSGFGNQDQGPDTVHLHARQSNGERQAILPGTSLAGVLRHRATRILRTLGGSHVAVDQFIDTMFGPQEIQKGQRKGKASRLVVNETTVHAANELIQNRIRIDRFTGGAYESALFNEQPVFGLSHTRIAIDLQLRNPRDSELGLLLLLLKDFWTGDLPLGGESSIGRGRLKGKEATVSVNRQELYRFQETSGSDLDIVGDRAKMENLVTALLKEVSS